MANQVEPGDHNSGENHTASLLRRITFLWRFNTMFCLGSLMKTVSTKDTKSLISSQGFHLYFFSFSLGLAVKDMEGHEEERLCGKWRVACGLYSYNLRDVFTWWALIWLFRRRQVNNLTEDILIGHRTGNTGVNNAINHDWISFSCISVSELVLLNIT